MEAQTSHFQLITLEQNHFQLCIQAQWNIHTLPEQITALNRLRFSKKCKLIIDFQSLKQCDSAAMIYFISFINRFKHVEIINLNEYTKLYALYKTYYQNNQIKPFSPHFSIEEIGRHAHKHYTSVLSFIHFIGQFCYFLFYSLTHPKTIRFQAMLKQIDASAIKAMVIISLTSFLVGLVIAYQGAVQLEKFGANIFIVEMICITMFREIAPMVTAIVIAGRTASSYTAEIGAMKITDEIDAMKTMGFEPTMFLTLPRVLALVVALPLLVFVADAVGTLAGMFVSSLHLDITYNEFIIRMGNEVPVKHLLIGIFKSIFFGVAIALIGCYRGFQVENNTTSIGKYTTISVVNAIFIVIVLNAIFSVILTEAGI